MTPSTTHADRVAIVTGAGGGIGLELASELVDQGAIVLGLDVKPEPSSFPGWRYLRGSVTDPDVAGDAVAQAMDTWGRLDQVANVAGIALMEDDGPILDVSLETWNRVIEVNLTGPMLLSRAALPPMLAQGSGTFVHVASIAGLRTMDDPMDAYQVSKAALCSLSRGLAHQYAHRGLRSNTVCPGPCLTPMVAQLYERLPHRRADMERRIPMGRLASPADIAAACSYLLSPAAGYVTGIDLVVDGGWLAGLPGPEALERERLAHKAAL